MIHAGVLMKLGAFGILRVAMFLCPDGWQYWSQLMALLAAVGIVYGVLVGLTQTDLKYVIGYSSVSHMGIVGLGLSTMTVDGLNGAVFQMFAHGIMTALFFSSVGYIYDTHPHEDDRGAGRAEPDHAGGLRLMSSWRPWPASAFPGLANFWAELLCSSRHSRSIRFEEPWPWEPWCSAPFSCCGWFNRPFTEKELKAEVRPSSVMFLRLWLSRA